MKAFRFGAFGEAQGFAVREIVTIVVLAGLLVAYGTTSLSRIKARHEVVRTVSSLRTFASALDDYMVENKAWPSSEVAAKLPSAMRDRIDVATWEAGPKEGAKWEWTTDLRGIRAAIAIVDTDQTDEELGRIDLALDDGNLGAGVFRKLSDGRVVYVLEN